MAACGASGGSGRAFASAGALAGRHLWRRKVPGILEGKAPTRVLIVGAGIIGASIAHHLARRGAAVTLVDRAGPAAEASGRSFGWINASYGNPEPYFRLRFQSLLEYRRLEWETGGGLTVKWGGSLQWEPDTGDLADDFAGHRDWGYGLRSVGREAFNGFVGHGCVLLQISR